MSNDAALVAIRAKLAESLSKVEIDLFGLRGIERFNFVAAVDNVASIVYDFWRRNGRAPAVLFNDGLPPTWKSALDSRAVYGINNLISPVTWTETQAVTWGGESAYGQTETVLNSRPAFNCKMWTHDGATVTYDVMRRDNQNAEILERVTEPLTGPYNSRFVYPTQSGPVYVNIPRSQFSGGVFQTWGVLLVALDHPEFVYATDEGLFLTMDGVAMIERSASYWLTRAIAGPVAGAADDAILYSVLGNGPVLRGLPNSLVEAMRRMEAAAKKESNPIMQLASFALLAVGFYFGASGVSGLLGGQFTIPNLSQTVNLASKFGVDTGELGPGLKLLGTLTGGGNLLDTISQPVNTAASAAPIMDDWSSAFGPGDWGPDPSSFIVTDAYLGDPFGSVPYEQFNTDFFGSIDVAPSEFSNADFYASLDFDPFTGALGEGQAAFSDVMGDWGPAPEAYDAGIMLAEQDDMLSHYMSGGVSAVQYAQSVGASPAVNAAAQIAMRQAGASPANVQASPQQAASAAQVAQQRAATSQNPADASIWSTAAQALNLYAQYQTIQAQQGRSPYGTMPTLPAGSPYSSGGIVRQPDGSISVRRADGTVTTIRPDGQALTTSSLDTISKFINENKTALMIGGAALVGVGLVFALRNRSR